jgi:PhnB protein
MKLSPFLLFDGNCAQAMRFYQECLGGELTITLVRDTPMSHHAPANARDKVAHAVLTSGVIELSATDWQHQTRVPQGGNTVALYLNDASYPQLEQIFAKLSLHADPELLDELRDMPFGTYGHLADQYGVHWFFRGEPSAAD